MRDFLAAIWPYSGYGEIRRMKDGQVRQDYYELANNPRALDAAQRMAMRLDEAGWDVYFGVLPRYKKAGTAEATFDYTKVLWADVDAKRWGGNKSQTLNSINHVTVTPSIIVDSGHGYHAYWLLEQATPFADARLAMQGIALQVGGDSVFDAPRVLRLPGTRNHKDSPPVPVRLLRFDAERRYRFSDFSDYVDRAAPHATPTRWRDYGADFDITDGMILYGWLSDLIHDGAPKGTRSEQSFKVCIWLIRCGWTEDQIRKAFIDNPNGIGEKYYEKGRSGDRWLDITLRAAKEAS